MIKNSPASSLPVQIEWIYSRPSPPNGRSMPLNQQVINGQIGSLKSSEFQKKKFRRVKINLECNFFFQNDPISTKFNPQKRKPAIFFLWASSADRKQQTELSKREKWLVPVFTIQSK